MKRAVLLLFMDWKYTELSITVPSAMGVNMSDGEVAGLNIPTGAPLVYTLDDDLRSLGRRYLGDPEAVAAAARAVAEQASAAKG